MPQAADVMTYTDRSLELHEWLPQITFWAGLVLLIAVVINKYGSRIGLPGGLLFLVLGMLVGEDGPMGINFFDFDLAYGVGLICLILILFYGGLNIKVHHMRGSWTPSIALATIGVVFISALVAVFVKWLGPAVTWPEALLVGSVLGSTDAAAVFAALGGVGFKGRVRQIVELESGFNDPMAFILVFVFTGLVTGASTGVLEMGADVARQFAIGAATGVVVGWLSIASFKYLPNAESGLYPVRTVASALASFGLASMLDGSGLLSVFLTGIMMGNSKLPFRASILRVHDSLAWGGQITMFFFLGLLSSPHRLKEENIVLGGAMIALWLAFVARPVAVAVILLPMRVPWRETACVAWLGLRGAVPIILSTIPILALGNPDDNPKADNLFDIVFICVIVGCIIPGTVIKSVPKWLGMLKSSGPLPKNAVDMVMREETDNDINVYVITEQSPVVGKSISQIHLPPNVAIAFIVRSDGRVHIARGNTRFEAGDEVAVALPLDQEAAVIEELQGVSPPSLPV
ncbi:MAG: potassium/proton antiporter [Planctomycetes bacterium]|nr:potassium/proton antiporter [Planctomycetota bacterium]